MTNKIYTLNIGEVVRLFFMGDQSKIEEMQTINKNSLYEMQRSIYVIFVENDVMLKEFYKAFVFEAIRISSIELLNGDVRLYYKAVIDKIIKLMEKTEGRSYSILMLKEEFSLVFIRYNNNTFIILAHNDYFRE